MRKTRTIVATLIAFGTATLAALPPMLPEKALDRHPPKVIRTCCLFGAEVKFAGIPLLNKTDIIRQDQMGRHGFMGGPEESNGIIYTRRGGFIDTGHLRDCADWTGYLYQCIMARLGSAENALMELGHEGGEKTLALHMNAGITAQNAPEVAAAIAYDLSLWHEIATWFGASYVPMIPEGYSSFSPEDLYSNLLGTQLGIKAIRSELPFEEAMDFYTREMLKDLGAVETAEETMAAMRLTESLWWSAEKRLPGKQLLIKRYFDIEKGLTPWLVPGLDPTAVPVALGKPLADTGALYTFSVRLNYKFPVKTLVANDHERTITQADFPMLVKWIEQDARNLNTVNSGREKTKRTRELKAQSKRQDREKKI